MRLSSEAFAGPTMERRSFVSLGGVWLDEIRRPNQQACKDVVGGSATYATLGARLFAADDPSRLTLVINGGYDFPSAVVESLEKWRVKIRLLINNGKCSTRGILEHNGSAGSKFTRLTPPLLTSPADIASVGALNSQIFHLFAAPELAQAQCLQLAELRRTACPDSAKAVVIWEPHPKSCTQPLLEEHLALLHDSAITVFSPNHHELHSFFDDSPCTTSFDRAVMEARARTFFDSSRHVHNPMRKTDGVQVIVIRAAEHGCLVLQQGREKATWLPAFFGPSEQDKIVDPTGAGNAFLGGLAQGWLETGDWRIAACYGMVAASVIAEHVGSPVHDGAGDMETWAGINVRKRLSSYRGRADVSTLLSEET
ncbi:hypothetical protein AMS68_001495 [Peltaster fructicola]|uniref:Carbohydrate kinase PfkB domain-containing protein n=1 Tax=Peltaster fructicola TaxID=286661 RepID=A0A6H0XMY6_9PEZI|nr:hypothetical protein AMS68_001495 [Peltaster fructicola]